MNSKVANIRFIVSSLNRYTGFYQQLLSNISSFQELGNRLIREAELAYFFRRIETAQEIGLMLSNIPLTEYRVIGQYYLGWCAYRKGENATGIFEQVIEQSDSYRTKALISLAAIETGSGDIVSGFKHYSEAAKYATNFSNYISAGKAIAVIKSMEGYHQRALKDLENLMPIARAACPKVYYDYLNSLAVELGQTGRKQEARDVCRVVLASPFIHAYPEWLETARDLREPSRSFLAVNPVRGSNVIRLTPRSITSEDETVATVLSIDDWKESKMPKKKKQEPPAKIEPTSPRTTKKAFEIRTKILVDSEISESKMDVILGLIDNRKLPQSAIDEIRKILESHESE